MNSRCGGCLIHRSFYMGIFIIPKTLLTHPLIDAQSDMAVATAISQLPAEVRWGDACGVAEEAGEVVGVAEAELRGHGVDGQVRVGKQDVFFFKHDFSKIPRKLS